MGGMEARRGDHPGRGGQDPGVAPATRGNHVVLVVSYSALETEAVSNAMRGVDAGLVVCDEAHLHLANHKSRFTSAFSELFKECPRRLFLSGTPWQV
jgi:superfamily II DNA or RNA helicase